MSDVTRAGRRAAYRAIARDLKQCVPTLTIAKVREALEQFSGNARRPIDAPDAGAWLPAYAFAAMAQALKAAERQQIQRDLKHAQIIRRLERQRGGSRG